MPIVVSNGARTAKDEATAGYEAPGMLFLARKTLIASPACAGMIALNPAPARNAAVMKRSSMRDPG